MQQAYLLLHPRERTRIQIQKIPIIPDSRAVIHQPAKAYIFQLHLRTRRFVKSRISSRPACWFPRSYEFLRIWGCNQIFRGWGTCWNSWRQVHDSCRSWFCHNSFFVFCSCTLFAIFLEQLIKLEFSAQQVELKRLMLNRWRRLFRSSHAKLLLVKLSASWYLVSMYLIWILGSRFILSNTQCNATRWVLDTCLIVRLRPLLSS